MLSIHVILDMWPQNCRFIQFCTKRSCYTPLVVIRLWHHTEFQFVRWEKVWGDDVSVQRYVYAQTHSTHWSRDKMTANLHTTFWNGFSWMKMYEFRLTFHWNLFPIVQLTIFQHGSDNGLAPVRRHVSHYLNQWWRSVLTHVFITRPQWANLLIPE